MNFLCAKYKVIIQNAGSDYHPYYPSFNFKQDTRYFVMKLSVHTVLLTKTIYTSMNFSAKVTFYAKQCKFVENCFQTELSGCQKFQSKTLEGSKILSFPCM